MEKPRLEAVIKSPRETQELAKKLAREIKPGDILAIYGPLGAGKTTFIQGLAAGLGYTGRVFSPTFIFVRPYKIVNSKQRTANSEKRQIKTLYHIDLYRIERPTDLKTVGVEEFLTDKGAVSAIEWPGKIEDSLPERTIKIKIETLGENKRKIRVGD